MLDQLPMDVVRRILELMMCTVFPVGIFPNTPHNLWSTISTVPQLWRAWMSGGATREKRLEYFARVMCESCGTLALSTSTLHGIPELFGAVHVTLGEEANSTILHTALMVASWSNNTRLLKYIYHRPVIRAGAVAESVYTIEGKDHSLCLLSAYPAACKWILRLFPNHTSGKVCHFNEGVVFSSPEDFAVCTGNIALCNILLQAMKNDPVRRLSTLTYVCRNLDIMRPRPAPGLVTSMVMRNAVEDINIALCMCMYNESAHSDTYIIMLIDQIKLLPAHSAREQLLITLFNRVCADDIHRVDMLLNMAPEFVTANSVHPHSKRVPLAAARSDRMVDMLVDVHGADARFIGWDGSTVAHMMASTTYAAASTDRLPLGRLKHHGCDFMKTTPSGNTALHVAVFYGNTAMIRTLLEVEPALGKTRHVRGDEPVFYAMTPQCLRQFPSELVRMRDKTGSTVLHHAVLCAMSNNFAEMVTIAIAAGVDPDAKNDAGATALDIATENGSVHAINMLWRYSPTRH